MRRANEAAARKADAESERLRRQIALEEQKEKAEREQRLREQAEEERRRQKQQEEANRRAAEERRIAEADARKKAEQQAKAKAKRDAQEAARKAEQERTKSQEESAAPLWRKVHRREVRRVTLPRDDQGAYISEIKKLCKQIINNYPDCPSADNARKRLKELEDE